MRIKVSWVSGWLYKNGFNYYGYYINISIFEPILELAQLNKLKFSGHESFHCRPFWLKKGVDYLSQGNNFTDKSGVDLGVGRNMAQSIRFWLNAFDLIDEKNNLKELALSLLRDDGLDPYLEDIGSLWLLHFNLCKNGYSSTYKIIFNELRKVRPEFNKKNFVDTVLEKDHKQSETIVGKDFSVFTRTYYAKPIKNGFDDNYSGLLADLQILSPAGYADKEPLYSIQSQKTTEVPWQILLYCLLEDTDSSSFSLSEYLSSEKGIGNIFLLNNESLDQKFKEIASNIKNATYSKDAGLNVLQFKGKVNRDKILESYYES